MIKEPVIVGFFEFAVMAIQRGDFRVRKDNNPRKIYQNSFDHRSILIHQPTRIIAGMTNKQLAIDFLTDLGEGRITEAFDKYVDMSGRHHNIYTPAGFAALRQGMIEGEKQFPGKKFEIQHVVADGDIVMVHSKIKLSAEMPIMATLHLLKFK